MARPSRRRPVRRGFSLLELIVVVAIIGILAALLLPAVQTSRATARQIQCMDHMRNVALAMENFSTQNAGRLPTLHHQRSVNGTPTWFPWPVQILNHVGQPALDRQWSTDPQPDAHLQVFTCPSDPYNATAPGGLSFVVNCGYGLYTDDCGVVCIDTDTIDTHVDAFEVRLGETEAALGEVSLTSETSRPHGRHCLCSYFSVEIAADEAGFDRTVGLDWDQDGVITRNEDEITRSTGVFWNPNPASPRPATMNWITNGDGTGATLLVSERTGSNDWGRVSSMWDCSKPEVLVGPSTMYYRFLAVIRDKGFGLSTQAFRGPSNEYVYPITGDWTAQSGDPLRFQAVSPTKTGAQCGGAPTLSAGGQVINAGVPFAPKGEHIGGVNAVFCDGHGKTLSNHLDPSVYALLLSPNGHYYGQRIVSDHEF